MASPVGAFGARRVARVDGRGAMHLDGDTTRLDWWIGADDRWHRAEDEIAVRQARIGVAPAYETAMRIPGGDAIQRVYAIGAPGAPVIVEVENDSPVPVVLAVVVARAKGVRVDDARVRIGSSRLALPRPAAHVAWARDRRELAAVLDAGAGAPAGCARASVVALLLPVTHRTRVRAALMLAPGPDPDLTGAPGAAEAARGWNAMLGRGMQVVFADGARQATLDRARADLLLDATTSPGPAVFAALEDWGLDAEAAAVWRRLGWRDRRAVGRRAFVAQSPATALLRRTRDALVREEQSGVVALVPEAPIPGASLEVHDAPTRAGLVSFALRWHASRPALLWDTRATGDVIRLVAPGLDAHWSTTEPAGETLFGPVENVTAR